MKHFLIAISVIILPLAYARADEPSSKIKALTAALSDPDLKVRHIAIEALGDSGDPAASKPLIALCDKSDTTTRKLIFQALARIPNNNAFEVFAAEVGSRDSEISKLCMAGLVALEDPKAIPLLTSALGGSACASLAETGLVALGDKSIPALVKCLSKNASSRNHAAKVLARIATPAALKAMVIPAKDPDWRKKLAITKAIYSVLANRHRLITSRSTPAQIEAVKNMPINEMGEIVAGFYSANMPASLRATIISALIKSNLVDPYPDSVLQVYSKAATSDADAKIRLQALVMFQRGEMRSSKLGQATLTKAIADKDPAVRWKAVYYITYNPDSPLIPLICSLLQDKDVKYRERAAATLAKFDPELLEIYNTDKAVLKGISAGLADTSASVRLNVLKTSLLMGTESSVDFMIKVIRNISKEDPETVRISLECMKTSFNPRVHDAVIAELAKANDEVASQLVSVLSEIRSEKSTVTLMKHLAKTESPELRKKIIHTLGYRKAEANAEDVVKCLSKFIDDDDRSVRMQVVRTLGFAFRSEQGLALLEKALVNVSDLVLAEIILKEINRISKTRSVLPVCEYLSKTSWKFTDRQPVIDGRVYAVRWNDRICAMQLLASRNDPLCIPTLIAELENSESTLHLKAITLIERLKDHVPVKSLIKLTEHNDPKVADQASVILVSQGNRGDKQVIPFLVAACKWKDHALANQAASALAVFDPVAAFDPFLATLPKTLSTKIGRADYARAIRASNKKDLVLALIETLYHMKSSVRNQSVMLLGLKQADKENLFFKSA